MKTPIYAAAVFRYQRELAVRFRSDAIFMCMDDKHQIKVGEPKYPVAATDRGRRVLVGSGETFEVADHDFYEVWDNSISDFHCRHT